VARLRSYWAARAGIEATLARLERSLDAGAAGTAFAESDDMNAVATGEVDGGTWSIAHDDLREERAGPADPHAKINVNLMTQDDLMLLDGMTEDVAQAIIDWIDEDDSPQPLGAEEGYYSTLASPYEPRNAPIPSLIELELAAGVTSDQLRGEDWNLNGRLDPDEDDGDISWPPDNGDGVLDAGWSAHITASSAEPGLSGSGGGELRLYLVNAATEDLVSRVPSIDVGQATVILDYASRAGVYLEDFISTPLSTIARSSPGLPATVRNLTNEQIEDVLAACTLWDPASYPTPGRLNLNTVRRETLDYIAALPAGLADSLMVARDGNASGFTSVLDLLEVPAMTPNRVAQLARILGVESGAYVITSRGRDTASGVQTTITVTVERRALPAPLVEVRTR
jgi:DNA uptake protein ComE-like DNA-binding protein